MPWFFRVAVFQKDVVSVQRCDETPNLDISTPCPSIFRARRNVSSLPRGFMVLYEDIFSSSAFSLLFFVSEGLNPSFSVEKFVHLFPHDRSFTHFQPTLFSIRYFISALVFRCPLGGFPTVLLTLPRASYAGHFCCFFSLVLLAICVFSPPILSFATFLRGRTVPDGPTI